MRQIVKFFWVVLFSVQATLGFAASSQFESVNFSRDQSGQLSFDVKGSPEYRYFTLNNPSRLVVDFKDTASTGSLSQPPANHPFAVAVRSARRNGDDFRVVVELNSDVSVSVVADKLGQDTRLQFDLSPKASGKASVASKSETKAARAPTPRKKQVVKLDGRDIVIAIDAGHGGKDVGAQGRNGTQEKDVVLAIAKRLAKAVNRQPGMKAVMIRDGDYFVKLHKRVSIAQQAKADLFVSIHADSFEDASAHGSSVYTLATKGASSRMAEYLANSENASDLAGGGIDDAQDDILSSVLMDLTNKAAKEASQHIGNKVLMNVKSVGHLHRRNVQKAGFVVLKSPIPSILVETAFISNPEEERRLNSGAYQDQMATAVFKGIFAHFKRYAPSNTLFAQLQKSGKTAMRVATHDTPSSSAGDKVVSAQTALTRHVITAGDTLSGIARQYGVSMRAIRSANDMENATVKIGQVLQIPVSS
ncbi:MAG: N-acetylmuramoyl-L-alanine amidase [Gammaproteobacteria bacterium]